MVGKLRLLIITSMVLVAGVLAASCGSAPFADSTTSTTVAAAVTPVTVDATTAESPRSDGRVGSSVKVPKLVGRFFFHAKRILEVQGLNYLAPKAPGAGGNGRRIVKQDPPPGAEVPEGYTVTLVIAPPPPKGGKKIDSLSDSVAGLVKADDDSDKDGGTGSEDGGGTSDDDSGDKDEDVPDAPSTKPQPKPEPKPQPEAKLSLVDAGFHSAVAGPPVVDVAIKNQGKATAYCVRVTANAYNAQGQFIEAQTQIVAPLSVAPGAVAYGKLFYSQEEMDDGPVSFSYSYTWSNESAGCSAKAMTVTSKWLATMPTGRLAVSGVVRNDTSLSPLFTYVLAAAYDASGNIAEIAMVELDTALLYPGGSVPYLIEFDYTKSVTKYVVLAQGI